MDFLWNFISDSWIKVVETFQIRIKPDDSNGHFVRMSTCDSVRVSSIEENSRPIVVKTKNMFFVSVTVLWRLSSLSSSACVQSSPSQQSTLAVCCLLVLYPSWINHPGKCVIVVISPKDALRSLEQHFISGNTACEWLNTSEVGN
jgi:hypothetical protein